MGGAIACILGYLIYTQVTTNTKTYTYGMAAVGDYEFSKYCKQFCYSLVNNCDLVPAMSIHSFMSQ